MLKREARKLRASHGQLGSSARFVVPAQTVDATPFNALIRQCFPRRSELFVCTLSKPSQGSLPTELTLASDLAFVFNASRVRPGVASTH
jgi:hypothetical protein